METLLRETEHANATVELRLLLDPDDAVFIQDVAVAPVGEFRRPEEAIATLTLVTKTCDGNHCEYTRSTEIVHPPAECEITEVNESLRSDPLIAGESPDGSWLLRCRLLNPNPSTA